MVKPNVKLNAELELVKMKNGMRGLLINDFTASKSLLEIAMNNGSFIDTDWGISHFGEHMILQRSEKYSLFIHFLIIFLEYQIPILMRSRQETFRHIILY